MGDKRFNSFIKIALLLISYNFSMNFEHCKSQSSPIYDPIKLVVLSPENETLPYALHKVVPAVMYAVQIVAKQSRQKIEVIYKDTQCSSTHGPIHALKLFYSGQVDVFLGPVCSYVLAPVSRYSCVWDVPLLTPAGRTDFFDKKQFPYSMITRMNGSFSQFAQFFLKVLKTFGWKVVALLYHNVQDVVYGHSDCHFAFAALYASMGKTPFYVDFDETLPTRDYVEMLKKISLNARGSGGGDKWNICYWPEWDMFYLSPWFTNLVSNK